MRPLILVTPSLAPAGVEMPDPSISLAIAYLEAVLEAGGLPLTLPVSTHSGVAADALAQAAGLLLTGGEDIEPRLHRPEVTDTLRSLCFLDDPSRDTMELELIREAFRRRLPVFALCRGHQLVNVALGGSLYVDLPSEAPGTVEHNQVQRRFEAVHLVAIEPDSQMAAIVGATTLGVNSTHHQAVREPAPGLRAAARAADGIIEALEWDNATAPGNGWFLSVQFHPERLAPTQPEHARLFAAFVEACRQRTQ